MMLFLLLRRVGYIKRLVWDQHELPHEKLLSKEGGRRLYLWICNNCDAVIFANEERQEYLQQTLGCALSAHTYVLRNYPDRQFCAQPYSLLPEYVNSWLGGQPFVLAQGGGGIDRHILPLVDAVLSFDQLKLIVIGGFDDIAITALADRHGAEFHSRVLRAGWIPQMEIASFIDNALASIILYDQSSSRNLLLCAPNRLYQAISRGLPVIVGSNPPLRARVGSLRCGVVLSDDGRDPAGIREAILTVTLSRDKYAESANWYSSTVVWEVQRATLALIAGVVSAQPTRSI